MPGTILRLLTLLIVCSGLGWAQPGTTVLQAPDSMGEVRLKKDGDSVVMTLSVGSGPTQELIFSDKKHIEALRNRCSEAARGTLQGGLLAQVGQLSLGIGVFEKTTDSHGDIFIMRDGRTLTIHREGHGKVSVVNALSCTDDDITHAVMMGADPIFLMDIARALSAFLQP